MKVRLAALRREQHGFTLIELMVVVAIIALLTTLAVPWLSAAIRKAKGGVGATDLYTFSGAMERAYLDDGTYPTDLATIKTKSYVKPSTTFKNRFGNSYLLITDSSKTWFVLADPGNAKNGSSITVTCGTWTSAAIVLSNAAAPQNVTSATAPAASDVGCKMTGDNTDTNFDVNSTNVVRN